MWINASLCLSVQYGCKRNRQSLIHMYRGHVQCVCVVKRICEHVCVFWPVRAWECGEGFLWYFKCLLLNITTRDHDQTPDTPPLRFLILLSLLLLLLK